MRHSVVSLGASLNEALSADELRRRELADFLRTRRARLTPAACGLPERARRRVNGLRREDVAALAGVSPSWYTKFEQGRDINISVRFLKKLAEIFKLTSLERAQLFELALLEPAAQAALPGEEDFIPALQRMIDAMTLSPAFILNVRGDYLGSNKAADVVFGRHMPQQRNFLLSLFLDPNVKKFLPEWRGSARYHVSIFRTTYARHVGNPAFEGLISQLLEQSPEFIELWQQHEVQSHVLRTVIFERPPLGRMRFEYLTFHADLDDNLRIDIFTPTEAHDTRQKVAQAIDRATAIPRKSARAMGGDL